MRCALLLSVLLSLSAPATATPLRPACDDCNQVRLKGRVLRVEAEKSRGRLQRVTVYLSDEGRITGIPWRVQCDESLTQRCAKAQEFFACRNTVTFTNQHPLRPDWTIETTRCRNPRALGKAVTADGFLYNAYNATFTVAVRLRELATH